MKKINSLDLIPGEIYYGNINKTSKFKFIGFDNDFLSNRKCVVIENLIHYNPDFFIYDPDGYIRIEANDCDFYIDYFKFGK